MVAHYNLVVEKLRKRIRNSRSWLAIGDSIFKKQNKKNTREETEKKKGHYESENYAAILSTYLFKVLIK